VGGGGQWPPLDDFCPPPQTFILGFYFHKTLTLGMKRHSISGEDLFFLETAGFVDEKDTPFPVKIFFFENAEFSVKKSLNFGRRPFFF